jgi:EAL domain-containing protein (putative c-di-GMP-specific phosphodiesterase class I)/GGDEF domain-containing protein
MFNITKKSDITKISIENLKSKIDEREQFLNSYLNFYRNTLFSLKYSNNFIEYLDYNTSQKTISNHFLNFAELLNEVAIVKYIDSIGFEKIRIEKTSSGKYIIQDNLQDKSSKEYFKTFKDLKNDEIGFSNIEYRTEYGKIIEPKELIVNMVTPVFDSMGLNRGYLVLSILFDDFFKSFYNAIFYNIHLVDKYGNFIFHHNLNEGFYSHPKKLKLEDEFGEHNASEILTQKEYIGDTFYSKKLDKIFQSNQGLILVLDLKYEYLSQKIDNEQKIFFISIFILAIIFFPFILKMAKKPDQLEAKIRKISNIDKITQLPNRIELFSDLKNKKFINSVIVLIHLDNYKKLKHVYGYEIIQTALNMLSTYLIEHNYFSREVLKAYCLDHDTFALKYFYKNEKMLYEFLEFLHRNIEKKKFYILDDIDINFDLTVVSSNPTKLNNNIDELKEAELALEHALKEKHEISIYNDEVNNNIDINKKNIEMVRIIKRAIHEDKVIVFFQPIHNNYSNKIEKYEALVRLQVDGKLYFPDVFLPIAKDIKKYKTITKILIDKTFEYFKDKDYEFSINLTMEDISNYEIRDYLFDKIKENEISNKLVIEIVESESIKNYREFIKFIMKIKRLGAKVAIDDFGSGYSNFEYIIKLNRYIDYLKVDGSLIRGIEKNKKNQLILGTIKFLCDSLEIKTIVEYVENKDSFDFVKSMNINYSQGYYIGKPNNTIEIEKFVS